MQDFNDFLEEVFIGTNEYNGIPITKDNCEDLFEHWLDDLDVDEWVKYAEEYKIK